MPPKNNDEQKRQRYTWQMLSDNLAGYDLYDLLTLPLTVRGRRWIPGEASVVGGMVVVMEVTGRFGWGSGVA